MSYGVKALHPSAVATDDRPHVLGFATARSTAGLLLVDVWNGPSSSSRKFSIDKDGNTTISGNVSVAATKKAYLDGGNNTYLQEDSADNVIVVAGGTQALRVTSTYMQAAGHVQVLATKKLHLDGGGDTYLYESVADTIAFVVGGVGALDIAPATIAFSEQNILINLGAGVGNGTGVVSIGNAGVVPNANPSGGGILYCEAGALKYRGSSGTVTTLGAA